MKTYCKDVSITDRDLVTIAVKDCLRKKQTRHDVVSMIADLTGADHRSVLERIQCEGLMKMRDVIDLIVDSCIAELTAKKLTLKPINYVQKFDSSSRKWRTIGVQDIRQQLYDYVAVYAMQPILRRVGEFQCASVPGRGQSYGVRKISSWLRDPRIAYAVKCDIKKCYPSIDRARLMAWLRERIRNDDLLWLIETLIGTFDRGLAIGSYLSQWLCNLWLSPVYHFAKEGLYKVRRGKRIPYVDHALFYMDDFLLLGKSKSDLGKAFRAIEKMVAEMGLTIKPSWRKWHIGSKEFIDMMGFRIYRDRVTIRQRIFLRIRRTFRRVRKRIETRKPVSLKDAQKCVSYFGKFKESNSFNLIRSLSVFRTISVSKGVIANEYQVLCR